MSFTPKIWISEADHEGPPAVPPGTPISAAALEDLETRVTDYTDAHAPIISVIDYGATGDGATDDTAAIQNAIDAIPGTGGLDDAGGIVYFPNPVTYYKLTDTLTIPDVRGIRMVGESVNGTELRMTVDNKPIFTTSGQFQRGISFEELRLSYTNQQGEATEPNSTAIFLDGPANTSCYHSLFRRLYIYKATNGIVEDANVTMWDCSLEDIQLASIGRTCIEQTGAGHLANTLKNISHLGESGPAPTGYALNIRDEATLINIDIEDWAPTILYLYGIITLSGLHVERWDPANGAAVILGGNGHQEISGAWVQMTIDGGSTAFVYYEGEAGASLEAHGTYLSKAGTGDLFFTRAADNSVRLRVRYPWIGLGSLSGFAYGTAAIEATRVSDGYGPVPTVGSGATVTLADAGSVVTISGTADITSITASWAERRVTLIFSGTAATNGLVDGSNLKLAGDFAYTPDDTITLVCDGTNWYEVARSAN